MTAIGYLFISVISFCVFFFFLSFFFQFLSDPFGIYASTLHATLLSTNTSNIRWTQHTHGTMEIYLNWTLFRCKVKIAFKITVSQCWCIEMCIFSSYFCFLFLKNFLSEHSFILVRSFIRWVYNHSNWMSQLVVGFFSRSGKLKATFRGKIIWFSFLIAFWLCVVVSFRFVSFIKWFCQLRFSNRNREQFFA